MNQFSLPEQYRKYYHSLEPMFAKPKTRAYSTVIFFFLVIALFGWYAIKPTVQTILYLRREIVDKTNLNKQMDDKINALITAQNILDSIQSRLTLLDTAIPSNPDAVDAARQIQNLTQINQASISAVSITAVPILLDTPGTAKQTQTYVEFPINVSFTGSYTNLDSVIRQLTNLQRAISISSLSMTAGKPTSASQSATIQAIIKLTAYYKQ